MDTTVSSQAKKMIENKKRIFVEFIMLSTARGFKNAIRSKIFWRILWIIALLAAWIYTIYQMANLIVAYLRYDAVESIKIKTSDYVPFPAVTLCNNNPIKNSLMRQLIDSDSIENTNISLDIFDLFQSPEGNYTPSEILNITLMGILMSERTDLGYTWANFSNGKQHQLEILRYLAFLRTFEYDYKLNYTQLGHSIDTMLLSCSYQGDNCYASNFSSFDHSIYGRCHTIIVDRSYTTLIGSTAGLVLTLNVESSEYIPEIWTQLGFQVMVHPHEYVPFPEDTGFGISPGSVTQVAIKQQRLTRLPYPYDNVDCGTISQSEVDSLPFQNYLNVLVNNNLPRQLNYSTAVCTKTCYLQIVYDLCGCIDANYMTYSMAMDYSAVNSWMQMPPACNVANDSIWECVQNVSITTINPSSICMQNCVQPCEEVKLLFVIKDNVWPRKSGTEYNAYLQLDQLANITPTDLTQHLVQLNVFFQDLTIDTITESPATNVFGLLSAIGGTVGLFVGIGALNILEIIQLFIAIIGCSTAEYRLPIVAGNTTKSDTVMNKNGTKLGDFRKWLYSK